MTGAVLSTIAFTCYLCMGFYVLAVDRRSPQNRNFFYFCLCFALWSFGYIMIGVSSDDTAKDLWQRIAYMGALSYEVFILRFFLLFTGRVKNPDKHKGLAVTMWIIPLIFMYMNGVNNSVALGFPDGFWYVGLHTLTNSYNALSLILVFTWTINSRLKREKRQGLVIFGGGLFTILITLAADYFFGYLHIPTITPFLILGWIMCLLFSMFRYRFLILTPEMIGGYIIAHIDEVIILLNNDGKPLYINQAATRLLGSESVTDEYLNSIFPEHDRLKQETALIIEGSHESFAARTSLLREGMDPVTVDLRFSRVNDRFGDTIGVLVIGKVVNGIIRMKSLYKVTTREIEIIEHLMSGEPNNHIAISLSISENTLKTHITSIYNKLGINNKIELINLLGEFNLLPEISAERRLLLKN